MAEITTTQIDYPRILSEGKYKKGYEVLAKRLSNLTRLYFSMNGGQGSYTTIKPNGVYAMNVDGYMFAGAENFGFAQYDLVNKALVYHESGHIVFTDFNVLVQNNKEIQKHYERLKEIMDDMQSDSPTLTIDDLEAEMGLYIKSYLMPDMNNSIEDASIEASMAAKYKESLGCLTFLRNLVYPLEAEAVSRISIDVIDRFRDGETTMDDLHTLITEIRMLGVIGYRKPITLDILPYLFDANIINEMKELTFWARFSAKTTQDRNVISEILLELIKPAIDIVAKNKAQQYLDDVNALEEELEQQQEENEEEMEQNSSMANAKGSNSQSSQGEGKTDLPLPMPESLSEEIQKQIEDKMNEEGQEGSSESNSDSDEQSDDDNNSSDSSDQQSQGASTDEGEDTSSQSQSQSLDKAAEKALKDALAEAQQIARDDNENIQKQCIERGIITPQMGRNHSGIQTVFRDVDKDEIEVSRYGETLQEERGELLKFINPFSKKLKKVLMHKARNTTLKGQYVGALDMKNLYRASTDGRVFRKDSEGESKHVRVSILVDESGSMCGNNLLKAMEGCYLIAKACQRCRIPLAVYGHHEYDEMYLTKYVDFKKSHKKTEIDNIFKMDCEGCNRDGLALYKVLCELKQARRFDDEKEILIIISDGQPNGDGYGGTLAITEMQEIMNTFSTRYDIDTIGVAIGSGAKEVARIYPNHVTVPDVDKLPDEMIKIMKNILL